MLYNMYISKISHVFKYSIMFGTRCVSALSVQKFSSALFVSGSKGSTVYSVLVPYIDFDRKHKFLSDLQHSIEKRGVSVNLEEIIELWERYKELKEMKLLLDTNKVKVSERIKSLTKDKQHDTNRVNQLKLIGKFIRQDLKTITSVIWSIEENVVQKILNLPNDLDENTPLEEVTIKSFMEHANDAVHHLEIGKKLDIIEFIDPHTYFLKSSAAAFELAALSYFSNEFLKSGFFLFSNPDFSRSVILEGCGLQDGTCDIIKLEKKPSQDKLKDELYLNGGTSVFPFCSYHTKSITDIENLPVRYVSRGRCYTISSNQSQLNDFYSVWQNSSVHIFVGSTENDIMLQLSSLLETVTGLYESTELPFRITYAPAKDLRPSEKLRVCFQVHSPFYKKYMNSGYISLHGDYFSKRLRMYYSENEELKFLHVLCGSVVNIPALLACSLEYRKEMFIPSCLAPYL